MTRDALHWVAGVLMALAIAALVALPFLALS